MFCRFPRTVVGIVALALAAPAAWAQSPYVTPTPAGTSLPPAAKDTLPLDTGTSAAVSQQVTTESTAHAPIPAIEPPALQPGKRAALPPDDRPLSLFNYGKIFAIGQTISWFYYNEHIDIDPLIKQFEEQYLYQPSITGTPKSSEYGAVLGFDFSVTNILRKPHLFIRSKLAMLMGIANTYDGSSQGYVDTSGGVGGIVFDAHKDQKNNLFFFGGVDIGYAVTNARCPWAPYIGIDAKVWYRDMTMYSQQSNNFSETELYYWFSVPLGATVTRPVSRKFCLGLDPRIDCMFYGKMQASESGPAAISFPAVKLGNRASFRLDAFMQTRPSSSVSLTFGPYVMVYGFAQSNTDTMTVPVYGVYSDQKVAFDEPASASVWVGFTIKALFLRERLTEEKAR